MLNFFLQLKFFLQLLRKFNTHLEICKFENPTLWAIKNITADLVQIKIELNETKNELAKTKAESASSSSKVYLYVLADPQKLYCTVVVTRLWCCYPLVICI